MVIIFKSVIALAFPYLQYFFAENQVFQFFVQAVDQGEPTLDSSVPVEVYVMSKKDMPPRFQVSERIVYTLAEDETIFSRSIIAHSILPVKYSILSGNTLDTNYPPTFEIKQNGKLRLVGKLDYNEVKRYHLTIQVKTSTTPALYDYVDIIIIVTDVNNRNPSFDSSEYFTTVIENGQPGDSVVQVHAYDEDTGSEIRYSFDSDDSEIAKTFNLDPVTGWITLINPLDRETTAKYNFTVYATDVHAKTQQTSATHVNVAVSDQNDNPPIFSRPSYVAAVNEGAASGTVLLQLTTTDDDIGENTHVDYLIVDGDQLGKFQIQSTGEVIVNKHLDREMHSQYELTVIATDGGMSTMTKITITILDDNDNDPVCDEVSRSSSFYVIYNFIFYHLFLLPQHVFLEK